MTNPSDPKGDPSPTEEELEAMLLHVKRETHVDSQFRHHDDLERLIHALRTARESARVATRERDEALRELAECRESNNALANHMEQFQDAATESGNECEGLRAHLRAHEETIGGLRATLQDAYEAQTDSEAHRIVGKALAATRPGEYEERIRREALEEAAKFLESREGTTRWGDAAAIRALAR